ncbi:hydroxymethylglutaryl-CoA synthase [Eremococcus coleocola]|uniref:Hydroxymethylglutaryl-CoA synthase n=1 Tax=Eremococcus coleocola ACS-139-V-Col8 TaxID=908337 RepID=E4KP77_9LACT|nr:hydroxymethylglutaryl-CoA synthase [Eremococcus coleocola]EFR31359.1 hydroxymethylglutaryl-CoA synthase [Eremococcus coleocola ACS-139-V-Col8]
MKKTIVGIDKIGFYVPQQYLAMEDLSDARHVALEKFTVGIGQDKMAVPEIYEDIVTMGANAAEQILSDQDKQDIDQIIFATESSFDLSKSAASYIHDLLEIQPFARSFEMKQACYSATAALQMAKDYVLLHPEAKVLVISSDISRYGLDSSGEVTQGAGALAFLVKAQPTILAIDDTNLAMTKSHYDFWRPIYMDKALVKGQYSTGIFLEFYQALLAEFQQRYPGVVEQSKAFLFHMPFTKIAQKALKLAQGMVSLDRVQEWTSHLETATLINRQVGNIYTGSLYMSLLSLLINDEKLDAGDKIAMFSYGSGAVAELFILEIQANFDMQVDSNLIIKMLENRKALSIADYERIYQTRLPQDGSDFLGKPEANYHGFYIKDIHNHQRTYGYQ